MYTLDFKEYLDMKKYFKLDVNQDMYAEFNEYILNGGFPKTLEFPDISTRQVYTRGIIGEIELLFFIIAMCNSAGCYYDMIDAAITICKEEK